MRAKTQGHSYLDYSLSYLDYEREDDATTQLERDQAWLNVLSEPRGLNTNNHFQTPSAKNFSRPGNRTYYPGPRDLKSNMVTTRPTRLYPETKIMTRL